ncbi:MAG TPA: Holliday junction resolvase RuvX [Planctomycetaceae bacterium]|nr:Holliday junction resolvase RuvX [Planctomycetaceae bacterium]HIQ22016.1 Holliday junction resolvase RuvX [Planctomycetota bacterium]
MTDQRKPPLLGRVAGIDFGTRRIGIAVSDARRRIASPYENYTRVGPAQDARRFQRLVAEEQIALFVVGLPVHLDGRESEQSQGARRFGQWLQEVTGVAVAFFDERFTTSQAEEAMREARLTRKGRKKRRDMVAAQMMLQAYLEAQPGWKPQSLDDTG